MIRRISVVGALMLLTAVMVPACSVEVDDPATGVDETMDMPDEEVGVAEEAVCGAGYPSVCTSWNGGGRRCLAKCTGINDPLDTGLAYWGTDACRNINYGDCTPAAAGYCNGLGRGFVSACWGWRR